MGMRRSYSVVGLLTLMASVFWSDQRSSIAEEVPELNPALGAIAGTSKWKESTFVVLSADGEQVVAIPETEAEPYGSTDHFVPPPGFGPRRFFVELKPGRYVVLAAAPGKRLAMESIDITANKMTFFWAILEEERAELRVHKPRDKSSFFRTKAQSLEEMRAKKPLEPAAGGDAQPNALP